MCEENVWTGRLWLRISTSMVLTLCYRRLCKRAHRALLAASCGAAPNHATTTLVAVPQRDMIRDISVVILETVPLLAGCIASSHFKWVL